VLRALVHPANEQDFLGGRRLLGRLPYSCLARLALLVFDRGYASDALLHWCQTLFRVRTQIVQHTARRFVVQPVRWVVERTFGWLNRFRRLSKDYEQRPAVAEGFIYLAMAQLMLRRLTRSV